LLQSSIRAPGGTGSASKQEVQQGLFRLLQYTFRVRPGQDSGSASLMREDRNQESTAGHEDEMMKKNVVVIGAGVGGAASGALLARAGFDVTVLEAHEFPGGRCASLDRDGFRYDFGVHMFSLGDRGPHGEVNRRLGGDLRWVSRNPSCRVMGKMEFDFPLDVRPLVRQAALARRLGVRVRNLPGAFRLFRALMRGVDADGNDRVTLREYVSRFTDDPAIHLFVNCVCQLYFALSYHEASAGEFIGSFSRMFQAASFGYPVSASGSIPESFLRGIERFGGRIRLGEAAERIRVENGRATAVETARGDYPADIVVSNCGMVRTLDLAGREKFPEAYVKKAEAFRYSNPYVTVKYALKRPVVPYPVVFHMPNLPAEEVFAYIDRNIPPEDPYIFMPVPTNHDPGLAPWGKQLVVAGTPAPAGASDELCRAILDRVHAKVCELFPDLEGALLWKSYSTRRDASRITGHPAGEAIGLGQVPGQVGPDRPSLRTPVQGLWLVGADAGARGIGTEMASASALLLADALTNPS
jgi:phytoene dehydrogenase-like protein